MQLKKCHKYFGCVKRFCVKSICLSKVKIYMFSLYDIVKLTVLMEAAKSIFGKGSEIIKLQN